MSALGMAQKFQLSFPTAQRRSGIVQIKKNHVQHIGIGSSIAAGFPNGAIEDRQAGSHRATGRIDVQIDRLGAVLGIQVQHLGHQAVGDRVIHLGAKEQDPLHSEAGVDVNPALVLAAGKAVGNAGGADGHGSREAAVAGGTRRDDLGPGA